MEKMNIFDRLFEVQFVSIDDRSTKGNPNVKVTFLITGDLYIYRYCGGHTMALDSVFKIEKETLKEIEVYSPWKRIPDGSYYQEIGIRLSLEHRKKFN